MISCISIKLWNLFQNEIKKSKLIQNLLLLCRFFPLKYEIREMGTISRISLWIKIKFSWYVYSHDWNLVFSVHFFPRIFIKRHRSNEKWYTFIIKLIFSSYVSCCNSFSLFFIVFWLISHRVISIKEWLRLEVHFLVSFIFKILVTIYSLFIYIYIYIHMHKHTYNITSTFCLKSIFNLMILLLLWS